MKYRVKKSVEKINETKSWFFERINKIDRPLQDSSRNKAQIKSEIREIIVDTAEIQRIINNYMPINSTIQNKWTSFLEVHKSSQIEPRRNAKSKQAVY